MVWGEMGCIALHGSSWCAVCCVLRHGNRDLDWAGGGWAYSVPVVQCKRQKCLHVHCNYSPTTGYLLLTAHCSLLTAYSVLITNH